MDKDLIKKLLEDSKKIHKNGSANFVIVSSQVSEELNKLDLKKLRKKKLKRILNG